MTVLEKHLSDGVATLKLNRPERKNAISAELREALIHALTEARADDTVRCVVITGAGDAFCSGVDLAGPGTAAKADPPDVRTTREAMRNGVQRVIRAIWELDKPVIASVNGVAAGAGAQLAFCCDLVLAAESARFIEAFSKRGLAVDSAGGWLLPRLIGMARAKELVFFGDAIGAAEAQRFGLVNRVVEDADLAKITEDWAVRLAQGATRAIGASKMLLNHAFESDLSTALEEEASAQAMLSRSEDFSEGIRAFLEKRDPDFKGR